MLRGKFVRIDKRLTLTQVATRSKVNRSVINQIENGRTVPRGNELARIAKALGFEGDPERLLDHVSAAALGDGAEARDTQRERSFVDRPAAGTAQA